MTITTMTTTYDERPATTTMTHAGSPQLEAFARCLIARVLLRFPIAPGVSVRPYVALLIKWRSVLRIFTAAPMSLRIFPAADFRGHVGMAMNVSAAQAAQSKAGMAQSVVSSHEQHPRQPGPLVAFDEMQEDFKQA